jgi:hypothetical protein
MRKLLLVLVLLLPQEALAGRVTVPVDVGIGPAANWITGPIADDQWPHYGIKLSVLAILDQQLLRRERNRIPPAYREMITRMHEIRFSPSILIPDSLIISPKLPKTNTAIYGITWKPASVGLPFGEGPVKLSLDAGVVLTSFYEYSTVLPSTFFLRPGLDIQADLEVMATPTFGFSIGWDSSFYIPERVGHFWEIGPLNQDIWHVGQAYFKFHFRFPYEANL